MNLPVQWHSQFLDYVNITILYKSNVPFVFTYILKQNDADDHDGVADDNGHSRHYDERGGCLEQ